jgi:hypothetical protein
VGYAVRFDDHYDPYRTKIKSVPAPFSEHCIAHPDVHLYTVPHSHMSVRQVPHGRVVVTRDHAGPAANTVRLLSAHAKHCVASQSRTEHYERNAKHSRVCVVIGLLKKYLTALMARPSKGTR